MVVRFGTLNAPKVKLTKRHSATQWARIKLSPEIITIPYFKILVFTPATRQCYPLSAGRHRILTICFSIFAFTISARPGPPTYKTIIFSILLGRCFSMLCCLILIRTRAHWWRCFRGWGLPRWGPKKKKKRKFESVRPGTWNTLITPAHCFGIFAMSFHPF